MEAAKQQAAIEKQKILDQVLQQASAEREKTRLAAEERRREFDQERLLREQEALRLAELEKQLQQEKIKLAQERQNLQEATDRLATLENERLQKNRELDLLREQQKKSNDALLVAKLDSEATNLDSQQAQLQHESSTLQNSISHAADLVNESEAATRNLEDQARRLQESLNQPIPPTDSLMDVDQSPDPTSPQTFQTPEGSLSDFDDENYNPRPPSRDRSALWDYIEVPNPIRPPLASFEPVQNQPLGRCPLPVNFPRNFTLILLEGLNRDYCMERGYCSILGTIITSTNGHRQIIDNVCILQAGEIERFSIDIVDEHLNSYSPIREGFVKLDLKLHRLVKSLR